VNTQLALGDPLADLVRGGDPSLNRQAGAKKRMVCAVRLKNLRRGYSIGHYQIAHIGHR